MSAFKRAVVIDPKSFLKTIREPFSNIRLLTLFGTIFYSLCKPQERHFCHLAPAWFSFWLSSSPLCSYTGKFDPLTYECKHWLTSVFCYMSAQSSGLHMFPWDRSVLKVTSLTGNQPTPLSLFSVDSCADCPFESNSLWALRLALSICTDRVVLLGPGLHWAPSMS